MGHPDEHTIDLLVVEPDTLGTRRIDVEAHLAGCPDCRKIADEVMEFYRSAETEYSHEHTVAVRRLFWLDRLSG